MIIGDVEGGAGFVRSAPDSGPSSIIAGLCSDPLRSPHPVPANLGTHRHHSENCKHLRLHDITEGLHGCPPGVGEEAARVGRQGQGGLLVAHQFDSL